MANVVALPQPVLHSIEYTGEASRDAEHIAKSINEVISAVGPKKVCAVVTDNAPVMRASWALLNGKYGHSGIFFVGCAAHITNLVLKDVFEKNPVASDLLAKAKTLAEFFTGHDQLYAALKKRAEGSVKAFAMPVKTRWWSQVSLLTSLIALKGGMCAMVMDDELGPRLPADVHRTTLDRGFWKAVQDLVEFMAPFANAIKEFEKDDPRLSVVMYRYCLLAEQCSKSPLSYAADVLRFLQDRFASLLDAPERGLLEGAFLLDPRRVDCGVDASVTVRATSWIESRCPAGLPGFMALRGRSGIFSASAIWGAAVTKDPVAWYRVFVKTTFPELADFACKVLTVPSSSAAVERIWSIFGHVHSKRRNRLTQERAGKLVFVRVNSALQRGETAETHAQPGEYSENEGSEDSASEDCVLDVE